MNLKNTYDRFNVTVHVLTPMHIGNGRLLWKENDYAHHNGRIWRINESVFVDEYLKDIQNRGTDIPPAQFLDRDDYDEQSELFRYSFKSTHLTTPDTLREQIKTTLTDEPYLPGTAIKGALRTALAWHGWQDEKMQPQAHRLGFKAKFAAQPIEQTLFGSDPNHDLMRALQVGDSTPASREQLTLAHINLMKLRRMTGKPMAVEAVRADTRFKLGIKLDRALFSEWAQQKGLKLRHEDWLLQLAEITHKHARERIAAELAWFKSADNGSGPADIYSRLSGAAEKNGPNQCLVQLGWGTGWGSKTLGSRLQVDADFMEHIIGKHKLAKGERRQGDAFPKTRRVTMNAQDKPYMPLGWAWLTFNPA